ncbi:major capsid protein [Cellulosilyticum sp. I15G10I2]|uniref:major capsid protein n=1 Tax=Cellulosilyticum sp. I15G10I2 TaxID=1892843 RepID=UPI00085C4289|nr:major capsid protein [Cellulosilyticum sp. I15G10I2]
MSIYDTKTMLAAISQKKPVFTFLRDTFFPNIKTLVTEEAEVDVKKGKRKLAPFVAPRVRGIVVARDGFVTNKIMTPKVAPIRVLTADDLKKRQLGESVYSSKTPAQRAAQILAEDLLDLDEQITRREEWFCAQVLQGEVIDIETEGQIITVDFNFTNKVDLEPGERWNEVGSDPLANMEAWRKDKIIKQSGKAPNIVIMASDVVEEFLANEEVQNILDIQRLNMGVIEPTYKGDGVTFIGRIPKLGVEIYSYTEFYIDEDGEEKELIPSGTVIMGSTGKGTRYYGSVTQKENGAWVTYEGERIPKYTPDDKNEIDELRLVSRPLPAPDDVDSWVVAKVL